MAPGPARKPGQARLRRRRRRFRPRRVLLISALICLPLLLAVPVARYFGWQPNVRTEIHQESRKVYDLVLTEARLEGEGAERSVRGVVFNRSGNRYVDVQVSFVLRSRDGVSLGTAIANLPVVAPNATESFHTGPVPAEAFRATLREISGSGGERLRSSGNPQGSPAGV